MATNEAQHLDERNHIYTCGCGKHCGLRCPHLDYQLDNEEEQVVARCDLFVTELVRETDTKPGDPAVLVRRSPRCSLQGGYQ